MVMGIEKKMLGIWNMKLWKLMVYLMHYFVLCICLIGVGEMLESWSVVYRITKRENMMELSRTLF